jgi:hypothetical protein
MHHSPRPLRALLAPAIVGLHALALISCEPTKPLQPTRSPSDAASGYESHYGVHFVTITTTDSSLTTGQQTQATGIPRDYYGNPIPEAPVTWSIDPTRVATISSTGLITGGDSSGTATVSATSDGQTRSMTITVTAKSVTSSSAPVHMISITANATSLNVGEVTQVNAVARDVNGTPISSVPITWSTSPTSVATVSTTNATSGVVKAVGAGTATLYAKADSVTRSITITVTDTAAADSSASSPGQVPMGASGASYGSATPAELPRLSVNTAYPSVVRRTKVAAGASLQAAIDAAQPGDELLLAPGATYTGNFMLRNKGSVSSWITIRTDLTDASLGYAGARMRPSRAASVRLARIVTPNSMPAFATVLGANHYRLTGLEITTSFTGETYSLVNLGDGSKVQNTLSSIAHDLIVDRSWLHGSPTQNLRRCLYLNSATSAVVDSWLSECHSANESQAILGTNGPGPYLIQNNHLEAGHEVIMFGGSSTYVPNVSPSDITIRGNHIMRPLAWKGVWQAKNLIESKHSRRTLIEGNVIENNWSDAQNGFALVLKSENQNRDTPWTQTTDMTIRYNRIRNVGSGINIAANPSGAPAVPAARFTIDDNVFENVGPSPYFGDGRTFQLLPGLADIVLMHNTVLSASGANPASVYLVGNNIQRLVIHSNILHHGRYGVIGDATAEGTSSLNAHAPGALMSNNAMVYGGRASSYPANNWFPAAFSNVGFVNLTAGDLRLTSTSPYYGKGYDGRDVGIDAVKFTTMTKSAVVAP